MRVFRRTPVVAKALLAACGFASDSHQSVVRPGERP
jgi:hypothetical protein